MVTEKDFSSVFDYSSAFKYGSPDIKMKSFKENYKSAFSYHSIPMPQDDLDNNFTERWPSIILRYVITYFLYVLTIFLFPVSIFLCLKKVHALERIVLLRLGKLQPIRGPGFAVVFPCIDKWTRVDLRPKHFTISSTQSLTADGGIVEAKSDIEYRVADVISYVMKLKQQESTLKDLSLMCLGNIISEKDQEDLEIKREIINCNFKNELNRSAINWGLEIISVNMHSVKILKTAEPVDAIGTLMTALKAATGQSSEHSVAMPSYIPYISENATNVQNTASESKFSSEVINPDTDDIIDTIKRLTYDVIKAGKLKDLVAKFSLGIIGHSTRKIFICFDKGNVHIFEDSNPSVVCDVDLTLTEDILREFLSGGISPLDAYMDGKVTVTGDWRLLKSLTTIFH